MEHDLLTVDELAGKLRVPKSWLYARTRYTGPEEIPRLRVGRYLRFHFDDVLEWLESKQADIVKGPS